MSDDIVARLRKEISKRHRPYPVELLPELREAADEIERLRAERDDAMKSIRWLERNQIRLEEHLVPPADAEGTRWLKFVTITSFSAKFLLEIGRSEAKRYFENQDNLRRALSSAVDRDWDLIVAYAQGKPMEDER